MAKKPIKKEVKKPVKTEPKVTKVNGIEVPEGAGDHKNPVVPIENAVNPTSPIYQA